jgi:hypothetical protein
LAHGVYATRVRFLNDENVLEKLFVSCSSPTPRCLKLPYLVRLLQVEKCLVFDTVANSRHTSRRPLWYHFPNETKESRSPVALKKRSKRASAPKRWEYRACSKEQLPKTFEGAKIVRVTEGADQHKLMFDLSYPIPDGGSDFPQRQFIFQNCRRYLVEERLTGEPTIQRIEIIETERDQMMLRLHTDNNGIREVTCSASVLEVIYS